MTKRLSASEALEQQKASEISGHHAKYADEYGTLWIAANQSAVRVLQLAGELPHKRRYLGTLIARAICEHIKLRDKP